MLQRQVGTPAGHQWGLFHGHGNPHSAVLKGDLKGYASHCLQLHQVEDSQMGPGVGAGEALVEEVSPRFHRAG